MNRPVRTAALLTLAFTFGALWIAFVTAGSEPPGPEWSLLGVPPIAATLLLMAALFLSGLVAASAAGGRGSNGSAPGPTVVPTAIAAVVIVGAVLGLVSSLRAVLWGGPAWRRWAIVGLATAMVVASSGRALGCAALGGMVWGAFGVAIGLAREPTERMDLILTGLVVGATVGAVAGTLLNASRRRGQTGREP